MKDTKRSSGVLMHISSLPGDYSCGDFGKGAYRFIDFLSQCGFTYWQVLPFCMVDECNSPYKSYSAFGGNPYFVDIEALKDKNLLTQSEIDSARQNTPYSCEFVRLYHTRFSLLKTASMRVNDKAEIESFISGNKYLEKFCEFMALKDANNQLPWNEWTEEKYDEDVLFAWKFIQYEFFMQWQKIRDYAKTKNIKIIGDIPIYVSYDSCDVWSNKELFQLDSEYKPTHVAGCPPDYFAVDGQFWGNPLYDWDYMKKDGFLWWKDRLGHMFTMFDGVRIDHFRGLESYWSIPADAETAKEGKWEKGPGKEFVDAIKEVTDDSRFIIAEDLGDITEDVIKLVNYSGFPGMRVLQFGFLGDDDNPHKPHNYPNNCIAYTGTHDNNTLLGYVWELDEYKRKNLLEYCGYTSPDWDRGYDAIIRVMFESHAGTVIMPIQDLLGYGSDTRLNIPGKADGNWQYRITDEQLATIDKQKYKRYNELYKR